LVGLTVIKDIECQSFKCAVVDRFALCYTSAILLYTLSVSVSCVLPTLAN